MKKQNNVLSGKIVFLRELKEKDATADYAGWLNDPIVNTYLETRHVTTPELKKYIREKNASANAVLFGIFWKENCKHIGNIKLEPIEHDKKKATMGILVGDKNYWGRGVATEATKLVLSYAFKTLKMCEVNLGVIAENKPAIHVYKKCGFVIGHKELGAVNHDGMLYDRIVMQKKK